MTATNRFQLPDPNPRPTYPQEAEGPIVRMFTETNRSAWISVSPTAIASSVLSALVADGWRLIPPATPDNGSTGDPR